MNIFFQFSIKRFNPTIDQQRKKLAPVHKIGFSSDSTKDSEKVEYIPPGINMSQKRKKALLLPGIILFLWQGDINIYC